ncbi:hypothetical protein [Bacilliculturomica massiliensis]|uniref:hypothetical protein n=1 Tax=Bacilliculturomica massiliensis TaxID=1917867 RepID=UPI002ED150C6
MRNRKKEREHAKQEVVSYARSHKKTTVLYIVLRILVILVMIAEIFNDNWNNVFLCVLTLVLFMIPVFVDRKLHIALPNTLEVIILLFIFAAEIMGEINEYYLHYPGWDDMLHTMNGFLMAAIGFSLIDILNQNERISVQMSPAFVALVAFCFSMTVGVLWEFFEFGMDYFTHTDMQKDTILTSISSVLLNPAGRNVAVTIPIDSIVVNGETWNYGGYIDIGLYDTMSDLFVNFIGAVVFSVIGMFYIKGRGKGTFARRFIPKMKTEEEIRQTEAEDKVRREKISQSIEKEIDHLAERNNTLERLEKFDAERGNLLNSMINGQEQGVRHGGLNGPVWDLRERPGKKEGKGKKGAGKKDGAAGVDAAGEGGGHEAGGHTTGEGHVPGEGDGHEAGEGGAKGASGRNDGGDGDR